MIRGCGSRSPYIMHGIELFAKWWQLDRKYLACLCILEGGDSRFLGAPRAGEKKTAVLPAAAAAGLKEGEKGHHWRAFSARMRASPARSEVLDRGRPR